MKQKDLRLALILAVVFSLAWFYFFDTDDVLRKVEPYLMLR